MISVYVIGIIWSGCKLIFKKKTCFYIWYNMNFGNWQFAYSNENPKHMNT